MELIIGRDGVARAVKVKQCGAVQVHSLKHLFPLELSLSVGREDEVMSLPSSASAAADDLAPQPSTFDKVEVVWLCPICNASQSDQAMICCDRCDNQCHSRCVRVETPTPSRQK